MAYKTYFNFVASKTAPLLLTRFIVNFWTANKIAPKLRITVSKKWGKSKSLLGSFSEDCYSLLSEDTRPQCLFGSLAKMFWGHASKIWLDSTGEPNQLTHSSEHHVARRAILCQEPSRPNISVKMTGNRVLKPYLGHQ